MRHTSRLAVALLAATCLFAADPPPPAGSTTMDVNTIELTRIISFTAGAKDGVGATQVQSLKVVMTPKPDPALSVTGDYKVVCDKAVTDAGENLVIPPVEIDADLRRMMTQRPTHFTRQGMMTSESIQLKYPTKPAKTIALSGSLTLTCEVKSGQVAELDLSAASVDSVFPGLRITVPPGQHPGRFAFSYTTSGAEDKVREWQLLGADGSVLNTSGGSIGSDGTKSEYTYIMTDANASVAKLRVIMVGELAQVRVLFSFPALPLDAPVIDEAARRRTAEPPPAPVLPGKGDF